MSVSNNVGRRQLVAGYDGGTVRILILRPR